MKNSLLVFLIANFFFCFQLIAQQNNLDINFDNGQTSFVVINSDAALASYNLSVTSGILKINTSKRAQDWSFLGLFSQNLNLSSLLTIQFRVKSSSDVTFEIRLKSKIISDPANMAQIGKTVTLTGGNDFEYLFFDITDDISGNPDFNASKIEEIQIECTKGWNDSFSGIVELDYLRLGFPKEIPTKGTGYVETFDESELPPGVIQNAKYSFTVNEGALEVNVNRDNRWFGFNYELDGSYDISANPIVNVDLMTETDMVMQLFLIDTDGKGYQTALVGDQYKYDELVADKNEYRSARIYRGKEFNRVTFDFSTAKPNIINLKKVAKIKFVSNGTAITFSGKYSIGQIQLGTSAIKMAYIGQLADHNYLKNTSGTKEILIPEIKNAKEIKISNATSLISNQTVTPITYTNNNENGYVIKYGFAKLLFSITPGSEGSDTISLTAVGNTGYTDNTMKFAIHIKGNNSPTIDSVSDVVVEYGKVEVVKLSGITSGDTEAEQTLTLFMLTIHHPIVTGKFFFLPDRPEQRN
jgi:hypothetical protein